LLTENGDDSWLGMKRTLAAVACSLSVFACLSGIVVAALA
jgi:hypothetical protein